MLASAADELAADRRLRRRALALDEVLADRLARARETARRNAGEHLLQHHPSQRVAISEVRIAGQRHLALAVDGPDPRALHRDAPAAERDLAGLVAMAHRAAIGVALALGAHDLVDLLFEQLGQHAEPGRDAQRQQPLLRCPDQLAQRLLHTRGQHRFLRGHGGRDRYGLLHGGSSFDLERITPHAANGNGRGGGTAVFKFYELRDNLQIRASLRYVNYRDRRTVAKDLRPIYTAANADDALTELERFEEQWGERYPMIATAWREHWKHIIPFLSLPSELRRAVYTTNTIEALHRQIRKAIKTRGHFPDEQSATKLIYLAIEKAEGKWRSNRAWTAARAGLKIHFGDRFPG